MSSGNPFRASQSYKQPAPAPSPQSSFINPDSSVPEARRGDGGYVLEDAISPLPRTKKQVRIESSTTLIPPHPDVDDADEARDEFPARRFDRDPHTDSPLAVKVTGFADNSVTVPLAASHAPDAWERYEMAASTILPTPTPHSGRLPPAISPGSAPPNPFSKTLASLEPQERGSGEDRTSTEKIIPNNSRASLDVESFKNLLMTGKPTLRPSAQSSQAAVAPSSLGGPHFESGSSTDTSSISRHSLFEPPQEVHTESPRTSYEMAESDEDEGIGLVSEVKKGKKKPPPAPKHRHGKLVTPRLPQIVSFDSFAATEPTPSPVVRSRENSDVNKPLPPTPVVSPPPLHISTQDTTSYTSTPTQQKVSGPLVPADIPTPQKRTPPPVPLARRQSQLRTSTAGNRSRSNSALTMSSQHSIDPLSSPLPNTSDLISTAKSPPPPPRSRHGARLATVSTSSANSSTTDLPQRSISVRQTSSGQDPPSTSRRNTLDSSPPSPTPGVARTSSISSRHTTHRVVSNESAGSASNSTGTATMPPPPPPPRRRQSNRSSFDQPRPYISSSSSPTESRRASTENRRTSLESKRRTSVASESSLRREYAPVEEEGDIGKGGGGGGEYALYSPMEAVGEPGKEEPVGTGVGGGVVGEARSHSSNILDDMDRFQRELDELRGKIR